MMAGTRVGEVWDGGRARHRPQRNVGDARLRPPTIDRRLDLGQQFGLAAPLGHALDAQAGELAGFPEHDGAVVDAADHAGRCFRDEQIDLLIGKSSVVRYDAQRAALRIRVLAMLTGRGLPPQTGEGCHA